MSETKGVLDGVKVLDLSRVLAGPYCAAQLADLGADVVKIESPRGDDARGLGPFKDKESVYFAILNRNKRSVTMNLKDEGDKAAFMDLVREADVLIENYRPGVTSRLGIDWDTLKEVNPKLIYASLSGFGQDGPFAKRPAYDLIVQAMTGIMDATGQEGGEPTRVGESLGDVVAGMFMGWSVCAALFDRTRTDQGKHIDVSMFDSMLALQVTAASMQAATGKLPGRIGNRHPVSVPFDTYPTKDGMVAIAVANDILWGRLATVMGHEDLAENPDYLGDQNRSDKLEELTELVSSWTRTLTTEEALQATEKGGIPAAPIWNLTQALESEQVRYRNTLGSFAHPIIGSTQYVRYPVRFETEEPDTEFTTAPSPALGESTAADVLESWK